MIIKVSKDNIAKGMLESMYFCPVARALKEVILEGISVRVYVTCTELSVSEISPHRSRCTKMFGFKYGKNGMYRKRIKNGPKVREFIQNFDKGKKMKPCELDLRIPKGLVNDN